MSSYEEDIIARHSTPGLKRNELTREAKKDHLAGQRVPKEEQEKILAELYGDRPPEGPTSR